MALDLGPMIITVTQEVRFRYNNWRGEDHEYVIVVESFQYGPFDKGGVNQTGEYAWAMHGQVTTRDGDPREDMETRRRTFLLEDIRDLETAR